MTRSQIRLKIISFSLLADDSHSYFPRNYEKKSQNVSCHVYVFDISTTARVILRWGNGLVRLEKPEIKPRPLVYKACG